MSRTVVSLGYVGVKSLHRRLASRVGNRGLTNKVVCLAVPRFMI